MPKVSVVAVDLIDIVTTSDVTKMAFTRTTSTSEFTGIEQRVAFENSDAFN